MSNQEQDGSPENDEKNRNSMNNMFASVWVKVEMPEYDAEPTEPDVSGCSDENVNESPSETEQKEKLKRKSTKTLTCDICEYTTPWRSCLTFHMLKHDETKPFKCTFCDYSTKYRTSLKRHTVVRHKKDEKSEESTEQAPLLKCDLCTYTTFYKWNYNVHKHKHRLKKQYKCDHCRFETAHRYNFIKHSKVHDKGDVFKCDKCPFITKYEGHITRHLAKIHNEVIDTANKCDYCDFATKGNWRLNIHMQSSKKPTLLKCCYCAFESFYSCEIKFHKINHHGHRRRKTVNHSTVNDHSVEVHAKIQNSDEKEIEEPKSESLLNNSQDKHTSSEEKVIAEPDLEPLLNAAINNQSVEVDAKVQNSEEEVIEEPPPKDSKKKYTIDPNCVEWNNVHVIESDDKEKPFSCYKCNYSSKFKSSVQRHFQRRHTDSDNRPYKCCNCDFSTKTKDQIAVHNKRSNSAVPISCPICKFTTYFKCQYAMHQKCHYDFKCSVCQHLCKDKYELQKHFSLFHLGKILKCQYCDYTAVRKDSLLCHETTHTGVKPFKCVHCEYTSIRKSVLKNHLKKYHSDIVCKEDGTIVMENNIQILRKMKKKVTIISESKIQSLRTPLLDDKNKIHEVQN